MKRRVVIFALLAMISSMLSYAEDYRYISDAKLTMTDRTYLVDVDTTAISLSLEARVALNKNDERVGYSKTSWSLVWNYVSPTDYYYATFRCGNTDFGDFLDTRFVEIKAGRFLDGNDSVIATKRLTEGVDVNKGYNSFLMDWSNGKIRIFVGSRELKHVVTIPMASAVNGRCGVMSLDSINISSMVVETKPDRKLPLLTTWTGKMLDDYFSRSSDKMEGYWIYLDRDNDEKLSRLGGRYTLATVRDGDGYLILYVSGAKVNNSAWQEGMIKGRLKSTIFVNHYDLEWFDSQMLIIDKDVHADVIDDAILSLEFPLYKTNIRFSKRR